MSIPSVAFVLLLCIFTSFTIDIQARDDVSGEDGLGHVAGSNRLFIPRLSHDVTDACKCGHTHHGRIVGGVEAEPGKWCWQVHLTIRINETHFSGCGGVVINDEYILTAAHCVHGRKREKIAFLGVHNIYGEPNQKAILAESVTEHPDYNPTTAHNDLAIVKLKEKIKYNDKICSVCLPNKDTDYTGKECIVTGWGRLAHWGDPSNVLRQAALTVISDDTCRKQYENTEYPKHPNTICASAPGKNACQGDSGGPLVHKTNENIWDLVGITSYGIGCAEPNFAAIYVNVYKYLPWIYKNTEGSKYCKREPKKEKLFPKIPNSVMYESVTVL